MEVGKSAAKNSLNFLGTEDFSELGFLQEANRQFFHPLGLSLAMLQQSENTDVILTVVDGRDDPNGITFAADVELAGKQKLITILAAERREMRINAVGSWIQPSGGVEYTRDHAIADRDASFRILVLLVTMIKEAVTTEWDDALGVKPLKDKIESDDRYKSARGFVGENYETVIETLQPKVQE